MGDQRSHEYAAKEGQNRRGGREWRKLESGFTTIKVTKKEFNKGKKLKRKQGDGNGVQKAHWNSGEEMLKHCRAVFKAVERRKHYNRTRKGRIPDENRGRTDTKGAANYTRGSSISETKNKGITRKRKGDKL